MAYRGFDGVHCPKCGKKVRRKKNVAVCRCGWTIKEPERNCGDYPNELRLPNPETALKISVEEYAEKMIRVSLERQLNEAAHRNGVVLKAEYGGETVTKSYDEEAWQAKSGEEIMEDINKIVEMVQTAKYLK